MKVSFARGLILAALLLVSGAQAAPLPPGAVVKAPDWTVGSDWYYSDGYAVKVSSVSTGGAVFERLDAAGQSFTRQGFIRTDSISATTTRNAVYRTVSDAAGYSLSSSAPLTFQREYLANGKLLVHASSWTVEGRETITVPAGTFDCWVLVWRTRSMRSDWTGFERWWYSPQAQNYVRMEYKYGPGPEGSRVLMTYNLVGSSAVPIAANAMPIAPDIVATPVQAKSIAPAVPAEPNASANAPHAPAVPARVKTALTATAAKSQPAVLPQQDLPALTARTRLSGRKRL